MKELQNKKSDTRHLFMSGEDINSPSFMMKLTSWILLVVLGISVVHATGIEANNSGKNAPLDDLIADCGVNGFVTSYAEALNGDMYIGGAFTIANGTTVNRIARWDGSHWHALGSGMDNVVYGLAISPSGDLIACGAFTTAGGVPVNYIALWDGIQWVPVGQGTNGPIETIAFMDDGSIVVGGQFTMAGGMPANYIAQYQNGSWQSLNSGMNNWVQTLVVSPSGDLYAGGRFTTVTNSTAMYIAKWNGVQWDEVGGSVNRDVRKLAFGPNGDLYAGGGFTTAGGSPCVRIGRWDGNNWSGLGGGANSTVTSIDFSGSDVYISGNFTEVNGQPIPYLARWANGTWSGLGTGTDGDVFALKVTDDGAILAGGLFTIAGGNQIKNIGKYQNNTWSGLCTPCVCTGPVTLLTQAEVDAFCCTGVFSGNLTIGPSSDINDLSPLNGITSVSGVLRIDGNSSLTDLSGLESLTSVNNLVISNNAVESLQGLNNLNLVSNNLALLDNPNLIDISALALVQLDVNASLNVINDDQLIDLDGLQGIIHARAVTIQYNQSLQNLNGLQNLADVDLWVRIQYNGLQTLEGLNGLTSLGNNLTIENNDNLLNLDALANLTQFHGDLGIRYNPLLQNIDGLSGLSSVMNVSIVSNNQLANLDGFIPLQTITTGLYILNNPMLYSCCGIYTALSNGSNTVNISGNPGCPTPADILNGCGDQDGDGYTVAQGDCNDGDSAIHPGAVDICNGVDDDCDGIVDNGDDITEPISKCKGSVTTVLDFDNFIFQDNQRHFYAQIQEEGFTLQQVIPSVFNQDQEVLVIHGEQSGFWWKGSPAIWLTLSSNPKTYAVLSKDDGSIFDVLALSLASQLGSVVPQSVTVEGVKPDGAVVSQTLLTTSATQLVVYTLNSSFKGLTAFRWSSASDGGFQVDDIVTQSGQSINYSLDGNGMVDISPEDLDNGSYDACGPVFLSLSKSSFTCEDLGINPIVLTAMDPAGNSSTCSVNVEITDDQVPGFLGSLPQNLTVDCQDVPPVPEITGQDNCSFTIDFTENSNYNGQCAQYDLIRTWTIRDASGNTNQHTQVVTVADLNPPVIHNCPESMIVPTEPVSCTALVDWAEPTATDLCSQITSQSNLHPGVLLNIGETLVHYIFTDDCGNQSDCQFNISVVDQSPPVPNQTELPDLLGCVVSLERPTAYDHCDGAVTGFTVDPLHYDMPGHYTVIWEYTDNAGNHVTQEQQVEIQDQDPPTIEEIHLLSDPVQIGGIHNPGATFTDLCDHNDHQAIWNWGDGNQTNGPIDQIENSVQGSHTYQSPGVYVITLVIIDGSGNADTAVFSSYAVVYDPAAGFVTGGGWIESPPGAYVLDSTLTGKANFGFVSKYQNGTSQPSGNTSFQFNAADLKFKSTNYDWLVIAGEKAKFKGSGNINNQGDYGFMLTSIDGKVNGSNTQDKFRIKIWDKMNENLIIYDNKKGSDDEGYDTQVLGGGSITIHKQGDSSPMAIGSGLTNQIPEFKVYAYPNPGSGELTIQIKSLEGTPAQIQITNLDGRLIWEYNSGQLYRGESVIHWDGKARNGMLAPAGIYYLVVKTPNRVSNLALFRF